MKRDLLRDGFTAGDFDKLRSTLAAHLSEIMPERDHREAIFNLIHDVKIVARDSANTLLREAIEGAPVVTKFDGAWFEEDISPDDTHQARLVCLEEIKGEK